MRQAPEFFESEELDLIFIAKKLKEALKIEDLLTEAGIDYAVEPDTYRGGLIFASERIGAFSTFRHPRRSRRSRCSPLIATSLTKSKGRQATRRYSTPPGPRTVDSPAVAPSGALRASSKRQSG